MERLWGPGRSQRVTTPHCSCGTTQISRAWGAPPTDSVLEPELDTPQSTSKRWLAFTGVSFSWFFADIFEYLWELKTVVTMCMYGRRTPLIASCNLLERCFCLKSVVSKRSVSSFGPNGTVLYFIASYHIHRSILCFTIACYIILYYIFLYSITSIALYIDIVLFCIVFCQVIYTILYCITLHHFTSLHFALFCSIILHCNTVHCITLFFALHFIVLCCIRNSMYQSATMWKKRGDWNAHCAVWCCSCLLCRHFSGFLDMKDVPMYVLQLFRKESWVEELESA